MASVNRILNCPGAINVVGIAKGKERYVFLFDDNNRVEALRMLGRFASNPDLSFTWHDATRLSQAMRECEMKTVLVDPKLPANFDSTPNDRRPLSHKRWWYRPYVVKVSRPAFVPEDEWLKSWPEGIRFDVRCLDGGAHDRSTCIGSFQDLLSAIGCARQYSKSLKQRVGR